VPAVLDRHFAFNFDAEGPKSGDRRKVGRIERSGRLLKAANSGSRLGPGHLKMLTRGDPDRPAKLGDFYAANASLPRRLDETVPLYVKSAKFAHHTGHLNWLLFFYFPHYGKRKRKSKEIS
jgi:hypothetical protein